MKIQKKAGSARMWMWLLLIWLVAAQPSEEIGYIVGLLDKAQPLSLPNQNGHIVTMTASSGQKFNCFLPDPNNPVIKEVEKDVSAAHNLISITDIPRKAQEVFKGRCFTAERGYWSYEVCPFHSVSQFHKEGGKVVTRIPLGAYVLRTPEEETTEEQYQQQYEGGQSGRKSLVRYSCNKSPMTSTKPRDVISDILEPAMLSYEIVISTDLACNVSSGDSEQDEVLALLSPFSGRCLYLSKGWWTYKLCFSKDITQFHAEPQPIEGAKHKDGKVQTKNVVIASFDLGKAITGEFGTEIVDTGAWDTSYVRQNYTGGTHCDLTGLPRRTQVQFFCSPQDEYAIQYITEIETCVYEMRVDTYHICTHPVFAPDNPRVDEIVCAPAVAV